VGFTLIFDVLSSTVLFISLFIHTLTFKLDLGQQVFFPMRIKDSLGGANVAGDVSYILDSMKMKKKNKKKSKQPFCD